ncbi:MAG TPA: amidohydrolase family protein [Acidimicrobiales bacterium]|jgi:predicted TIM-barrel fold metal-dependent hydrolase|nr:amidohydrolase family protein [Acidimicrobiales bacterium]
MEHLGHAVFDADNHYYEAEDAFTRHLDPALGPRCVQWATIDGRKYHVVGGRVSRAVTNATFDPISKPGCLYDYFRGNAEGVNPLERLRDHEPIRAEYRDPDARLRTLDDQGLAGCWLFPTLGMIYEELIKHDPEATCLTFRAFNRWLLDDWGFNQSGRIFAAPYLTLAEPQWAVDELEWALDHGAQLVVMRAAAPTTDVGRRSPFDPMFERFWSRLDEAGVTLVVHAGDSGVSSDGYAVDGFAATFSGAWKPSLKNFAIEKAVHDYLLSMVLENHFVKYPNLRVASVENGAEFVPDLFRKLRSVDKKMRGWFPEDPVEIFRRHIWINPFWEDDLESVIEWVGADRVLFGSDWPHIEALPEPLDYLRETKRLGADDRRRVLHDNAMELITPRPR